MVEVDEYFCVFYVASSKTVLVRLFKLCIGPQSILKAVKWWAQESWMSSVVLWTFHSKEHINWSTSSLAISVELFSQLWLNVQTYTPLTHWFKEDSFKGEMWCVCCSWQKINSQLGFVPFCCMTQQHWSWSAIEIYNFRLVLYTKAII